MTIPWNVYRQKILHFWEEDIYLCPSLLLITQVTLNPLCAREPRAQGQHAHGSSSGSLQGERVHLCGFQRSHREIAPTICINHNPDGLAKKSWSALHGPYL